jgi:hypothetical protein
MTSAVGVTVLLRLMLRTRATGESDRMGEEGALTEGESGAATTGSTTAGVSSDDSG